MHALRMKTTDVIGTDSNFKLNLRNIDVLHADIKFENIKKLQWT